MDRLDGFFLTIVAICVLGILIGIFLIRRPSEETCATCITRCAPYAVQSCHPLASGVYCTCNTNVVLEK